MKRGPRTDNKTPEQLALHGHLSGLGVECHGAAREIYYDPASPTSIRYTRNLILRLEMVLGMLNAHEKKHAPEAQMRLEEHAKKVAANKARQGRVGNGK